LNTAFSKLTPTLANRYRKEQVGNQLIALAIRLQSPPSDPIEEFAANPYKRNAQEAFAIFSEAKTKKPSNWKADDLAHYFLAAVAANRDDQTIRQIANEKPRMNPIAQLGEPATAGLAFFNLMKQSDTRWLYPDRSEAYASAVRYAMEEIADVLKPCTTFRDAEDREKLYMDKINKLVNDYKKEVAEQKIPIKKKDEASLNLNLWQYSVKNPKESDTAETKELLAKLSSYTKLEKDKEISSADLAEAFGLIAYIQLFKTKEYADVQKNIDNSLKYGPQSLTTQFVKFYVEMIHCNLFLNERTGDFQSDGVLNEQKITLYENTFRQIQSLKRNRRFSSLNTLYARLHIDFCNVKSGEFNKAECLKLLTNSKMVLLDSRIGSDTTNSKRETQLNKYAKFQNNLLAETYERLAWLCQSEPAKNYALALELYNNDDSFLKSRAVYHGVRYGYLDTSLLAKSSELEEFVKDNNNKSKLTDGHYNYLGGLYKLANEKEKAREYLAKSERPIIFEGINSNEESISKLQDSDFKKLMYAIYVDKDRAKIKESLQSNFTTLTTWSHKEIYEKINLENITAVIMAVAKEIKEHPQSYDSSIRKKLKEFADRYSFALTTDEKKLVDQVTKN
jgi:hypothetical protein